MVREILAAHSMTKFKMMISVSTISEYGAAFFVCQATSTVELVIMESILKIF